MKIINYIFAISLGLVLQAGIGAVIGSYSKIEEWSIYNWLFFIVFTVMVITLSIKITYQEINNKK